jgi:hypothetical protein
MYQQEQETVTLQPTQQQRDSKLKGRKPAPRIPGRTTRLTVSLSLDLVSRLRDAVYWTPRLTVTRLVEESIRASLAELESINRGPFPPRAQELKPGRPRVRGGLPLTILPSADSSDGPAPEPVCVRPMAAPLREEVGQECPV